MRCGGGRGRALTDTAGVLGALLDVGSIFVGVFHWGDLVVQGIDGECMRVGGRLGWRCVSLSGAGSRGTIPFSRFGERWAHCVSSKPGAGGALRKQ